MRTVLPLTCEDLQELSVLVPEAVVAFNAAKVETHGLEVLGDAITVRWDRAMPTSLRMSASIRSDEAAATIACILGSVAGGTGPAWARTE